MPDTHLTGTIADRYEIVERLGAGGMGEVYSARDTKLHRDVAIKRLAPALASDARYRTRLLREARAAARVSHQGLAALYDVLEEGDDLFLVMEHVEGRTLTEVMKAGDLDVDEILKLIVECAEAIAAAHHNRVVHRDITPSNIMVTETGAAKVLDFGLAHAAAAADPDGSTLSYLEGDSGVVGTPPYMAPEALLGKKIDFRADIFSLGVVAYQLLTARNPFFAATPTAISDRILHLEPPPIVQVNPSAPVELEPIVRKMIAKDREHRYATMDDVLVDLRAVRRALRGETTGTLTGPVPPVEPAGRSAILRWGGVAAILAVVLVGYAYWPTVSVDPEPPIRTTTEDRAAANMMLAVLPVHDRADDEADVALADGLTSTLAARLGPLTRNHDFQLIPSLSLRARQVDSVETARLEFGCNRVLTVALRRQGERLRADLGLVDARTGAQIDGAQITGTAAGLFDFEEAVADRVLRMLELELRPTEKAGFQAGTTNVGARELYLSGVGYHQAAESEAEMRLAIDQFRQALRADPDFAAAHAALGNAYMSLFQFDRNDSWLELALQECQTAIDLDDLEAAGHACFARHAESTGDYDTAITAYERARDLAPTNDAVVRRLAGVLRTTNQLDAAEETYLRSVAMRPHYAAAHHELGGFYLLSGRPDEAIDAYEQAAQLAPDSWRVHNNLGNAYYYAEDHDEAIRAWRRAVELNPDYAIGYSNLGTLMFYQGNYADSAPMFERAVELDPEALDFWGNLGDARWFSGDREAAREAFARAAELADEALAVNSSDAESQSQAAYYRAMLGDAAAARRHADQAVGLEPGSHRVLRKAAQARQMLGDTAAAVDLLRRAVAAGYSRQEIRADPVFAALAGNPDFERIVAESPSEPE